MKKHHSTFVKNNLLWVRRVPIDLTNTWPLGAATAETQYQAHVLPFNYQPVLFCHFGGGSVINPHVLGEISVLGTEKPNSKQTFKLNR